jgi:quercetin dioxygenase-like cupin family protein
MYENRLAERKLKKGDVYQIPAGSAFYLSNTKDSQKLHIVCSIDPSESLGLGIFQVYICICIINQYIFVNLAN